MVGRETDFRHVALPFVALGTDVMEPFAGTRNHFRNAARLLSQSLVMHVLDSGNTEFRAHLAEEISIVK